jgi:hypothetical protein
MKTLSIFFFLVLFTQSLSAQSPEKKWHINVFPSDTTDLFHRIRIDTILGDTGKYFRKSHRYLEVTKEGVEIVDGHWYGGMGTACGCRLRPHGYWIERYRNGNLKEHGTYDCKKKIGTWIYYYENGQIAKIEHLKRPYEESYYNIADYFDIRLDNRTVRDGAYLEYYPNGQIKVDGFYTIIEAFSTVDTLVSVDPETYELLKEVIEGEFWLPKSYKTGHWSEYAADGTLISHEYNRRVRFDGKTKRPIESRYYFLLEQLEKKEKEQGRE